MLWRFLSNLFFNNKNLVLMIDGYLTVVFSSLQLFLIISQTMCRVSTIKVDIKSVLLIKNIKKRCFRRSKTVNDEWYIRQKPSMKKKKNTKKSGIILHHDNARTHTATSDNWLFDGEKPRINVSLPLFTIYQIYRQTTSLCSRMSSKKCVESEFHYLEKLLKHSKTKKD